MNEIAEAADVSTPHLYNFYASKAALALAVQLKMGQETFDALKTAMSAGKKNPSCESIFDSRRSSLMLTILTECTRNPDIKEKITENGARLRAMISEAGGISQDDQEGQYRILCVMAMYLGMSISNIFTLVENRELMTKILAPEFGRFRQTKSSQLFDYQRVQSFLNYCLVYMLEHVFNQFRNCLLCCKSYS